VDDRAVVAPLFEHCEDFGLRLTVARAIARDMARVVARWREYAQALRLPQREIQALAPAFEHPSLADALRGGSRRN
jgi:hypothetical protein